MQEQYVDAEQSTEESNFLLELCESALNEIQSGEQVDIGSEETNFNQNNLVIEITSEMKKTTEYKNAKKLGQKIAKYGSEKKESKPDDWSMIKWQGYQQGYKDFYIKNKLNLNDFDEMEKRRGFNSGLAAARKGQQMRSSSDPNWTEIYWNGYQEGFNSFSKQLKKNDNREEIDNVNKNENKKYHNNGYQAALKGLKRKDKKPNDWSDVQWQSYNQGYDSCVKVKNLDEKQLEMNRGFEAGRTSANRGIKKRLEKMDKWSDLYWESYQKGYDSYVNKDDSSRKRKKDPSNTDNINPKLKKSKTEINESEKQYNLGKHNGGDSASKGKPRKESKPEHWTEDYWRGYVEAFDSYIIKHNMDAEKINKAKAKAAASDHFSKGNKYNTFPKDWTAEQKSIYEKKYQQLEKKSDPAQKEINQGKADARENLGLGRHFDVKPEGWSEKRWEGYQYASKKYIQKQNLKPEDLEYRHGITLGYRSASIGSSLKKQKPKLWSEDKWQGYQDSYNEYVVINNLTKDKQEFLKGINSAQNHLNRGNAGLEDSPELWSNQKWAGYCHFFSNKNINPDKLEERKAKTQGVDIARKGYELDETKLSQLPPEQRDIIKKSYKNYISKHNISEENKYFLKGQTAGRTAAARGVKPGLKPYEWTEKQWEGYQQGFNEYIKNHHVTAEKFLYSAGYSKGYKHSISAKERLVSKPGDWDKHQWEGYLDGYDCATPIKSRVEESDDDFEHSSESEFSSQETLKH